MTALEAAGTTPDHAAALSVDLEALRIDRGKTTYRTRRGPGPS